MGYLKKLVAVFIYISPLWIIFYHEQPIWIFVIAALLVVPLNAFAFSTVYHKLFAHRAFEPKIWVPILGEIIGALLFLATPFTFAAQHRLHHRFSDTDMDPHTPKYGKRFTYFPYFFTNKKLKAPDSSMFEKLTKDLARDFPTLYKIKDTHVFLFFIVFNTCLFFTSYTAFAVSISVVFLNLNLHGFANTFFHNVNKDGTVSIINMPFFASILSPEFNHAQHHDVQKSHDFTTNDAKDWMAPIIERFLSRK